MLVILAIIMLIVAFLLALKSARDELKREKIMFGEAKKEDEEQKEAEIEKVEPPIPKEATYEANQKILEIKEKLLEGEIKLSKKEQSPKA